MSFASEFKKNNRIKAQDSYEELKNQIKRNKKEDPYEDLKREYMKKVEKAQEDEYNRKRLEADRARKAGGNTSSARVLDRDYKKPSSAVEVLNRRIADEMGVKDSRSEKLVRAESLERIRGRERDRQLFSDQLSLEREARKQALEELKARAAQEDITGTSGTLKDLSRSISKSRGENVSESDVYQLIENEIGQIDNAAYEEDRQKKKSTFENIRINEKDYKELSARGREKAETKSTYKNMDGVDMVGTGRPDILSASQNRIYQNMTEEEKNMFGYYLETQGQKKAKEYMETIERDVNKRVMDEEKARLSQMAEEHPALSSVASVPAGWVKGAGYLETVRQNAENAIKGQDVPVDVNAPAFWGSQAQSAIRETVQKDMGELGKFLYQTGMSMGDFLSLLPAGPAALPLMSTGAATDTAKEVISRGGSNAQATQMGLVAGAAELVTEKIGIDRLSKLVKAGRGAKAQFIKQVIAEGAIPEGMEEVVTELVNNAADDNLMQDLSDKSVKIKAYMERGLTRQQAEQMVIKERIKETALAFAGGALSGAVMGGGAYAAGYLEANDLGGRIAKNEGMEAELRATALQMEGTQAQEMAKELEEKELSNYERGMLYEQVQQDMPEVLKRAFESEETPDTQTLARQTEAKTEQPTNSPSTEENTLKTANTRSRFSASVSYEGVAAEVTGIDRVENGKIHVKISTGDNVITQPIDRISFEDADTERLYRTAENYGNAGARNFILEYKGESFENYKKGFDAYYNAGLVEFPKGNVHSEYGNLLTQSQQAAAYQAGITDMETNLAIKYDAMKQNISKATQKGNLIDNTKKLPGIQRSILKSYAKISGTNIIVDKTINNGKANGYYDGQGNIHIAYDSDNPFSVVTNHELTHHIQQYSALYDEYKQFVVRYLMEQNGTTVDELIDKEIGKYVSVDRVISRDEALDEIVANAAEMFLTDKAAINELTQENPSLARKILDFIRDLIKDIKTALQNYSPKSKEAQMLNENLEIAKEAERLWIAALQDAKRNTEKGIKIKTQESQKFSLNAFEKDGRRFVIIDQMQHRFEGHDRSEYPRIAKNIINEMFNGKVIGQDNKMFVNGRGRDEFVNPSKPIKEDYVYDAKMRASAELDNLLDAGTNFRNEPDGKDGHKHKNAVGGFDYFDTLFKIGQNYFEGTINIENIKRGKLFKDLTKIKDVTEAIMNSYGENPKFQFLRTSSNSSISQNKEKATEKGSFSLKDSQGRDLSQEQQDYFVESKVRNEKGELLVMYHGSPAQFTVFDKKKAKSSGYYGRGFYFTDSDTHAGQYGERYEVYLNIKNPVKAGTRNITKEQLKKFVSEIAENEDYGIDNYGYGATVDSVTDSVYGKDDFAMLMDLNATCVGDMVEAIKLFNEVNGTDFDGIITSTETVVFYPEQIKNVTNESPTDNPDIRFAIKEGMTDKERYNELKDKKINVAKYNSEKLPETESELRKYEQEKLQTATKRIKIIAEKLGIIHDKHTTPEIVFEFSVSKETIKESVKKQTGVNLNERHLRFAKMLTCLDDILNNAVLIKKQTDTEYRESNSGHKPKENLKYSYTLFSAYEDENEISPVRITIFEFNDGNKPKIHVLLTFKSIKKAEVVKGRDNYHESSRSAFDYSISNILKIVKNDEDYRDLGKYIPEEFAKEVTEEKAEGTSLFSLKDTAAVDYESLKEENSQLREINQNLQDMIRLQEGSEPNQDEIEKVSRFILKKYQSAYDIETLKSNLTNLWKYIANSRDVNADEVARATMGIAKEILNQSRQVDRSLTEQYKDLIKEIRTTKITLNESYYGDMDQVGGYAAFRKAHFGAIRLGKDGIGIDSYYQSLTERYPELFQPEDAANPADQLIKIADTLEMLRPSVINPYGMNMDQAAADLAYEIYDSYFNISKMGNAYETKKIAELNKARSQYKERQKKLRQEFKEAYEERLNELRQENARLRRGESDKLLQQKAKYDESARRRAARREESEDRTRLLKALKRISKMNSTPENMKRAQELIGDIDLVAKSMTAMGQYNLEVLRDRYNEMLKTDPDFVRSDAIEEKIKRLDKERINDMGIQGVRELLEAVLEFEHKVQTDKKLIDSEYKKTNYELAREIEKEVKESKGYNPKSVISDALNKYNTMILSSIRELRKMSGYKDESRLVMLGKELNDGQLKATKFKQDSTEYFDPFVKGNKEFMDKVSDEFNIYIGEKDGKKYYISKAMRISLYLHSKNEANLRHIIGGTKVERGEVIKYSGGGITVPDVDLFKAGKVAEAYARGENVKLTKTGLQSILSGMTAKETELANLVHNYLNGMASGAINETSLKLDGYERARVTNYFPIRTDANFTTTEFEAIMRDASIEGMGILKARSGGVNPVMLEDVLQVVNRQMDSVSKYYGLAIPVRNFNKIFNSTATAYEGSVKKQIAEKWGTRGIRYIENLIADVQGARKSESSWIDKIRGKYAQAVLTLNPSVTMKQAASFPTAAATIGWKPVIKALNATVKVDRALIDKYTPLLWYRNQGNMTNDVVDAAKAKTWEKKLPDVVQWNMNWIQNTDTATVKRLWLATEYYVQDNFKNLKKDTDAYYKKVAEIYNQVIEDTQPNYTVMQRPDILRSTNQLTKALTMFSTQRLQNYNIVYDAVGEFRAKKAEFNKGTITKERMDEASKKLANAISSQVVSAAVISVMTFAAAVALHRKKNYEDEDGTITWSSVMRQMANDFASTIAGSSVGGSELYSLLYAALSDGTWYGVEAGNVQTLNDVLDAVKGVLETSAQLATGEATWQECTESFADLGMEMSKVFGIPLANIQKIYNSGILWFQDIKTGSFLAADDKYYALDLQMLAAQKAGDKKKMSELEGKMTDRSKSKITAGLNRAAIRELNSKAELNELKEVRKAGDLKGYKKMLNELVSMGYTEKQIISAANSNGKDRLPEYTYDELYEVLRNEDETTYESMFNTMVLSGKKEDTIKTEMNKRRNAQIKEENPKFRKAAEAKAAGNQKEYERLRNELAKEYADEGYDNSRIANIIKGMME